MKITTSTGFECEIDEEVADDFEILESVSDMAKGGMDAVMAVPRFVATIAGKENYTRLKEHCRKENGRVSTDMITNEVKEIMGLVNDSKKK